MKEINEKKMHNLKVNLKNISKIACTTVLIGGLVYGGSVLTDNRPYFLDRKEIKKYDVNAYSRDKYYRWISYENNLDLVNGYVYYVEPYREIFGSLENNCNDIVGYQSYIYRFKIPNADKLTDGDIASIIKSDECDLCQMFGEPTILANSYISKEDFLASSLNVSGEHHSFFVRNEHSDSPSMYITESKSDDLVDQYYFWLCCALGIPLSVSLHKIDESLNNFKKLDKKIV